MRVPAAAHVVNLAATGGLEKLPECFNKIEAVDIVTHLLALVAEDAVWLAVNHAFHQVRQETVQFRTGMARPCQATAAEANRFHSEIAPVLLDHDVGRGFAGTE